MGHHPGPDSLVEKHFKWFLYGNFVLETFLYMEPPTCGSLITTIVAMIAKINFPPDLLNILSMMWRRPSTPHPLSCFHPLPGLNNHMVM